MRHTLVANQSETMVSHRVDGSVDPVELPVPVQCSPSLAPSTWDSSRRCPGPCGCSWRWERCHCSGTMLMCRLGHCRLKKKPWTISIVGLAFMNSSQIHLLDCFSSTVYRAEASSPPLNLLIYLNKFAFSEAIRMRRTYSLSARWTSAVSACQHSP